MRGGWGFEWGPSNNGGLNGAGGGRDLWGAHAHLSAHLPPPSPGGLRHMLSRNYCTLLRHAAK